jgi:2-phosphoglycerate kinase
MAIIVVDHAEKDGVPFLRGILTRSLVKAGLSFDDAYRIADGIRDDLDDDERISTDELAERVAAQLKEEKQSRALRAYRGRRKRTVPIDVLDRDGHPTPFSKSVLARSLEICALPDSRQFAITAQIERDLLALGLTEVSSIDVARRTYELLKAQETPQVARRFLAWIDFTDSGRPLFLLVGGTTGSGKSTVSAEIAHRLNIVRTQSTDMLREVMRLILPQRLLPTLHASTFNAWELLPTAAAPRAAGENLMIQGYLSQASHVALGIEGVFRRGEREQVSILLEGVHMHPALQIALCKGTDAVAVPMLLAVLKKKSLKRQLSGRALQVSARRAERYLKNFDSIWGLQSFLLSQAEALDVPIVPNADLEDTIKLIMEHVAAALVKQFGKDPRKVLELAGSAR